MISIFESHCNLTFIKYRFKNKLISFKYIARLHYSGGMFKSKVKFGFPVQTGGRFFARRSSTRRLFDEVLDLMNRLLHFLFSFEAALLWMVVMDTSLIGF